MLSIRLTFNQLLKKVHLELMTELSPPTSVDPLTVLPRELAEQILDYLTFRQLMNTCLVSKQWSQFIRRTPNLWRHLDLTHAKRKVKNTFVSRAINTGRLKLKTATLNNLFDFDKALSALARICPLEELNLRDTGLLSNEIVEMLKSVKTLRILRIYKGTTMFSPALSSILQHTSTTLETLVCEDLSVHQRALGFQIPPCDFPNLQKLDLAWSSAWRGSHLLTQSLSNMPNLRDLKLHELSNTGTHQLFTIDLSGLASLSTLDLLLDVRKANRIMLPTTVKSLAIGTWKPQHARFWDDNSGLEPLQWSLPLLEELRLCVAETPFDKFELALRTMGLSDAQKPARLHSLSMTASDVRGTLTKETLSHPRLAELKHLSLECCHGVDDSHLSLVAATLTKLQSLNVSGTEVTGAGIKEVVNNGLKKLVANDSRFVGLDAIQWARSQGVQVEHRNTDALSGGKKLRY
jgi:F-box/TPR repeat protein Pof3